ncbi:hypothetical protein WJX75_001404 [Coccomyxa subellipsoidea]|uniref:Uncharacterized protein n=1 Tax=Coccomyxa subellipsoidea TaxID=248742 RepID=A0ABR2Z2D8_9CHLO
MSRPSRVFSSEFEAALVQIDTWRKAFKVDRGSQSKDAVTVREHVREVCYQGWYRSRHCALRKGYLHHCIPAAQRSTGDCDACKSEEPAPSR